MKLIETDAKSIAVYTSFMGIIFITLFSIFVSEKGFNALFNKFNHKTIIIHNVSLKSIGRSYDRSLLIEDDNGSKYVSKCIGLPEDMSCYRQHDDSQYYYSKLTFMDMGKGEGFILNIIPYDGEHIIENKLNVDDLISFYKSDNLLILILIYLSMFSFVVPVSVYLIHFFVLIIKGRGLFK